MIAVEAQLTRGTFKLDVAFTGESGITALFGRSGSGKSTTIAVIAGLLAPDRGRVVIDGHVLLDTSSRISIPKHRRRTGVVFQDALLFPHLTVRQNLLFGRWFSPVPERVISFDRVIDTLGIGHLLERRPAGLSGGERQRVAIGRALLAAPKILLLDEPLASLDRPRKLEILPLIEALPREFEVPVIYVSHAIEEVSRLAGRVVVLDEGHVVSAGAPEEVLDAIPAAAGADRFAAVSVVAGVLGEYNPGHGLTPLHHSAGTLFLPGRFEPAGRAARVVIRATDVALATQRPRSLSIRNVLQGRVTAISAQSGPLAMVTVALQGQGRVQASVTRFAVEELGLGEGDQVYLLIKTVALDAA